MPIASDAQFRRSRIAIRAHPSAPAAPPELECEAGAWRAWWKGAQTQQKRRANAARQTKAAGKRPADESGTPNQGGMHKDAPCSSTRALRRQLELPHPQGSIGIGAGSSSSSSAVLAALMHSHTRTHTHAQHTHTRAHHAHTTRTPRAHAHTTRTRAHAAHAANTQHTPITR